MKLLILAVTMLLLFSPVLSAGDPKLTAEERAKAIKLLQDSQKEFLDAVEKLNDAQWNYKPAPLEGEVNRDRWSVAQVAEHIMLAEGLLFGSVEKALASAPNPDWETKTEGKAALLERALLNRERKAQAPEAIQPQSKLTRAEIMSRFREARAKTLKFIEETDLPMKQHTLDHPFPIFGTLNAYQWLIYIPLHNMRHDLQIAEAKASEGFPK